MGNDAIPDAVLQCVLLRLESPIYLLRAASTCKQWRRVVTDAGFLRRLCALKPPVAGCYYNRNLFFRPRFEPSPLAAAVDGSYSSLDFLPSNNVSYWRIRDSRGSLLLVHRHDSKDGSVDMIVCEPLTQRYQIIPPMIASANYIGCTILFVDGEDAAGARPPIGMSNFRLYCLTQDSGLHAGIFTSGPEGSWLKSSIDCPFVFRMGEFVGRQYWHDWNKRVVVLDKTTLEFSSSMLPDDEDWNSLMSPARATMTLGRDGEARFVVGGPLRNLKIFARLQEGWVLEKSIQLSAATFDDLPQFRNVYSLYPCAEPEETGTVQVLVSAQLGTRLIFRLDIETMEAERLLEKPAYCGVANKAFPCEFPWPPSLRAYTA